MLPAKSRPLLDLNRTPPESPPCTPPSHAAGEHASEKPCFPDQAPSSRCFDDIDDGNAVKARESSPACDSMSRPGIDLELPRQPETPPFTPPSSPIMDLEAPLSPLEYDEEEEEESPPPSPHDAVEEQRSRTPTYVPEIVGRSSSAVYDPEAPQFSAPRHEATGPTARQPSYTDGPTVPPSRPSHSPRTSTNSSSRSFEIATSRAPDKRKSTATSPHRTSLNRRQRRDAHGPSSARGRCTTTVSSSDHERSMAHPLKAMQNQKTPRRQPWRRPKRRQRRYGRDHAMPPQHGYSSNRPSTGLHARAPAFGCDHGIPAQQYNDGYERSPAQEDGGGFQPGPGPYDYFPAVQHYHPYGRGADAWSRTEDRYHAGYDYRHRHGHGMQSMPRGAARGRQYR